MNPIRIDIPSARFPATLTPDGQRRYAQFLALLRQAGVDPRRASRFTYVRDVTGRWAGGRLSDADFARTIRNLAQLLPTIRRPGTSRARRVTTN